MKKMLQGKILILFLISIIICFTGSIACERKKESTEFIGFPQSFAELAEKVKPAVVNIRTETTVRIPGSPSLVRKEALLTIFSGDFSEIYRIEN